VFNTRALGEVTGTTQLKVQVENLATSRLNESSGKVLNAKQCLPGVAERPDSLSAILFRGSGRESPEAKVRSGSKRTLGGYHETHKGAGLKSIEYIAWECAETRSRYKDTCTRY